MPASSHHIPVLLSTVLASLAPQSGDSVLDATLGLGGHAEALLRATSPHGTLVGLDADAKNLASSQERLSSFDGRTTFYHCNFGKLAQLQLPPFDIILADLGLSSPHIDDPARGFTFREPAPLDLRFDSSTGMTASELLRQSDVSAIKVILRDFGELFRDAHRLAITLAGQSFEKTTDLVHAVEQLLGYRAKRILPQIFQALRIAVNDELTMLDAFLAEAPLLLKPGGRIGMISFHSLEDRRVKQAFRALSTSVKDPVTGQVAVPASFVELSRKPMVASPEECADNPRARSAKFRVLRRVSS